MLLHFFSRNGRFTAARCYLVCFVRASIRLFSIRVVLSAKSIVILRLLVGLINLIDVLARRASSDMFPYLFFCPLANYFLHLTRLWMLLDGLEYLILRSFPFRVRILLFLVLVLENLIIGVPVSSSRTCALLLLLLLLLVEDLSELGCASLAITLNDQLKNHDDPMRFWFFLL